MSQHTPDFEMIGNLLSAIFAGILSGGVALFLFKALLIPAVAAAVGGVVGFYVNRLLKNIHAKKDKKKSNGN